MPPIGPLHGLSVGMRAVVRHRVPGGLTDAVGLIEALDAGSVSIDTPRGLELIAVSDVTVAKQVPPRPSRRGAPHHAISIQDLERIMVDDAGTVERERLGDWVLRASAPGTTRASSLLPLGDPHVPLDQAIDQAQRWYAARGLPCRVRLSGPAGFAAADDPLGVELLHRGYTDSGRAAVLTAATAPVSGGPPDHDHSDDSDDHDHDHSGDHEPTIRVEEQASAGSPGQILLRAERQGACVGTARVVSAHVWSGVFGLGVAPQHRRSGVATTLLAAAGREARARGIRSIYARVASSDTPALALFKQLGFSTHHECCSLVQTATSGCR